MITTISNLIKKCPFFVDSEGDSLTFRSIIFGSLALIGFIVVIFLVLHALKKK